MADPILRTRELNQSVFTATSTGVVVNATEYCNVVAVHNVKIRSVAEFSKIDEPVTPAKKVATVAAFSNIVADRF